MKQSKDHLSSFQGILLKIKVDIYIYNWALYLSSFTSKVPDCQTLSEAICAGISCDVNRE